MQSSTFWKAVLVDRDNLLERFLEFMRSPGARYCLIGGAGINAYAYPVVTEDLDIVVAADQIDALDEDQSVRIVERPKSPGCIERYSALGGTAGSTESALLAGTYAATKLRPFCA